MPLIYYFVFCTWPLVRIVTDPCLFPSQHTFILILYIIVTDSMQSVIYQNAITWWIVLCYSTQFSLELPQILVCSLVFCTQLSQIPCKSCLFRTKFWQSPHYYGVIWWQQYKLHIPQNQSEGEQWQWTRRHRVSVTITMELVVIPGISKPIRKWDDNWMETQNEAMWSTKIIQVK